MRGAGLIQGSRIQWQHRGVLFRPAMPINGCPSNRSLCVEATGRRHDQAQASSKPTLVFDIMDTIVQDPFFEHMPRFFSLSFHELLAAKHPTAWVEFEKAQITEQQLFDKFFHDGRDFDGPALVQHMIDHYSYVDGMQQLLARLEGAGYSIHAMSNYPEWWRHIEAKLRLSTYLHWTFISCEGPMQGLRKPSAASYDCVTSHLQLPPSSLIFVDDRAPNVDAAAALGWGAIHFKSAQQLEAELTARGLQF